MLMDPMQEEGVEKLNGFGVTCFSKDVGMLFFIIVMRWWDEVRSGEVWLHGSTSDDTSSIT